MNKGRVVSIMGPVVDIEFERGQLPKIFNAIKIETSLENGRIIDLTLEVSNHLVTIWSVVSPCRPRTVWFADWTRLTR